MDRMDRMDRSTDGWMEKLIDSLSCAVFHHFVLLFYLFVCLSVYLSVCLSVASSSHWQTEATN